MSNANVTPIASALTPSPTPATPNVAGPQNSVLADQPVTTKL